MTRARAPSEREQIAIDLFCIYEGPPSDAEYWRLFMDAETKKAWRAVASRAIALGAKPAAEEGEVRWIAC